MPISADRKPAYVLAAGLTLFTAGDIFMRAVSFPEVDRIENLVNLKNPPKWRDVIKWARDTKSAYKRELLRGDAVPHQVGKLVESPELGYAYYIVWDHDLNEEQRNIHGRELRRERAATIGGKAFNIGEALALVFGYGAGALLGGIGGLWLGGRGVDKTFGWLADKKASSLQSRTSA